MFFPLSKLLWILFAPDNFFLFVLIAGAILLFTRRAGLGKTLVMASALFYALVYVLPVGDWLIIPLEERFPRPAQLPATVDGIVILGGGLDAKVAETHGDFAVNEAGDRLLAMAVLARRYPKATIVYSGGPGDLFDPGNLEAVQVKNLVPALGLDPGRMIFESASRNTYENAVESYRLAKPEPGQTWLLVTSAFHMPRSMGVFRQAGWKVIPYPVDYRTTGEVTINHLASLTIKLASLVLPLREWLGLTAYYLTGKSAQLFPGP